MEPTHNLCYCRPQVLILSCRAAVVKRREYRSTDDISAPIVAERLSVACIVPLISLILSQTAAYICFNYFETVLIPSSSIC
ncbi:hypothetical protein O3M35_004982 [Rhynocoris fuscipes]|uniref:Uncharacterized protein n=1 Tax=Rhynocoris fuscipes TaxID=488301 RepID=A0AAW1DP57_9HEMI